MPGRRESGLDENEATLPPPLELSFLKLPAEWVPDLERCQRDYQIEYEHIERLRRDLSRSPKLRTLVRGATRS